MQVIVNGLLTHYSLSGKGNVVMLLHGWGDSSLTFAQLQKQLSADFEVLAIDLPGFGGTQSPPGTWGLNDYTEFVAATCNKLQLKIYAFIGHSNGGAIAIRGLSSGVLNSKRLVLLASAGIRNESKGRNKMLKVITKAGKALTSPLPQATKQKIQKQVYSAVGSDMLVAEHLQETFKSIVGDDVRADAAKIQLPVLLIYGDQDEATPLRYGMILHEAIKNSAIIVLPNIGHFVHNEEAEQVEHLIKEFLL